MVFLLLCLETIYEACIKVATNLTKSANKGQKYQGEILIDYEASTHFLTEGTELAIDGDFLQEEDIIALRKQVNHVINATK